MPFDMAHQFEQADGSFYVYGDVDGLLIEDQDEPMGVRLRTAQTPDRDGDYSAGGLLAERHFTVRGILKASALDDLRSKWYAFRAAHRPGPPRKWYVRSDIYRFAECDGITDAKFDSMASLWLKFAISFRCSDPFDYAATPTAQSALATGGTITTAGTAESLPALTIVIASISSSPTITVTNTTTGDSFTIIPSGAGTYVVDSLAETVKLDGVDALNDFSGSFLTLAPGDNIIPAPSSANLTLTSIDAAWNDRFV